LKLAVRAFVDTANTGSRVAQPKGDEHPHQLAVRWARELEHESEGTLRRRCIRRWEIELGAARELRAIGTKRVARQNVG